MRRPEEATSRNPEERPGIRSSRPATVLLLLATTAVAVAAAFPASIWDQDEAYFAASILRFDPVHVQPHPPFYPLWILAGTILHGLFPGHGPAFGLRLLSGLAHTLLPLAIVALWRRSVESGPAAAGALLFAVLPGPWLLAGRAYTEPAATLLLLAGAAALLADAPSVPKVVAGGLATSAAFLVRPQWIPLAGILCLSALWRFRGPRRFFPAGIALLSGGTALAVLIRSAGGTGPLVETVRLHAIYQSRTLAAFTWRFPELGFFRATGGAPVGIAWAALTLTGAVTVWRRGAGRGRRTLLLLVLPLAILTAVFRNPTLPRYAIPILAAGSGLTGAGAAVVLRSSRRGAVFLLLAALGCVLLVSPHLPGYRATPSPAVRLLQHLREPDCAHTLLVADHRLAALVTLQREEGHLTQRLIWDWAVAAGRFSSPPRDDLVAVWDGERPRWARGGRVEVIGTGDPFLASLASPRFVHLSVCRGCAVGWPPLDTRTPGAHNRAREIIR